MTSSDCSNDSVSAQQVCLPIIVLRLLLIARFFCRRQRSQTSPFTQGRHGNGRTQFAPTVAGGIILRFPLGGKLSRSDGCGETLHLIHRKRSPFPSKGKASLLKQSVLLFTVNCKLTTHREMYAVLCTVMQANTVRPYGGGKVYSEASPWGEAFTK